SLGRLVLQGRGARSLAVVTTVQCLGKMLWAYEEPTSGPPRSNPCEQFPAVVMSDTQQLLTGPSFAPHSPLVPSIQRSAGIDMFRHEGAIGQLGLRLSI